MQNLSSKANFTGQAAKVKAAKGDSKEKYELLKDKAKQIDEIRFMRARTLCQSNRQESRLL